MEHKHESNNVDGMRSRTNIALIVFLAIAAFFLVAEHKAHLSGYLYYLPYLLLLACPLLHVFMHGKHGGHGGHSNDGGTPPDAQREGEKK